MECEHAKSTCESSECSEANAGDENEENFEKELGQNFNTMLIHLYNGKAYTEYLENYRWIVTKVSSLSPA